MLPDPDTLPIVAAMAYARQGFRTFPLYDLTAAGHCACPDPRRSGQPGGARCASRGKHPRITEWQRGATDDIATVREWWRRWPRSGVALAMGGAHRLVALDVDGDAGRATLDVLEAELGTLPATLTSRSGRVDGGEHRVFVLPSDANLGAVRNRASVLGPGLDVRAEGGQIVVAPSLHVSGGRYAWTVCVEPAELPAGWAERLTKPADQNNGLGWHHSPEAVGVRADGTRRPRSTDQGDRPRRFAQAILEKACATLRDTPRGRRNDTASAQAYALGGLLWTEAWSADHALSELVCATRQGGWSREAETHHLATMRRQMQAGERNPRSIPPLTRTA